MTKTVLLTGATGFVGQALVRRLIETDYKCIVVTRSPDQAQKSLPAGVEICRYDETWPAAAAAINLAGETIAGRWTARKRQRVVASRVSTTRQVVTWIQERAPRPTVFLSMSAVGIYGNRPGTLLNEQSALDTSGKFRALVTLAWEHEARGAEMPGVRVALMRLGNVLHPEGGFLAPLLRVYRQLPIVGLAPSNTMFSWISRQDTVRLIMFALENEQVSGPVNMTAPAPIAYGEMTQLLAERLDKRVWGNIPRWALRLGLGSFADAILDSQEILPEKATALGFRFNDTELGPFLKRVL